MIQMPDAQVLDPDLPIVDPHHHLWDRPGNRYFVDDLLADLTSGHDIRATAFVQCRSMYRPDGPEAFKPVGEVEFVVASAEADVVRASGIDVCAAISGHADLRLGDGVGEVLAALVHAGKGRLRGIRHIAAFDAANDFGAVRAAPGMLRDLAFRAGYAQLARHGLLFEAWLYHPQLPDLLDLAQRFPQTTIVLNHVGGPLGTGTYEGRRAEVFADWANGIRALTRCPNVVVKLGGFGMPLLGFGFDKAAERATYETLAAAWRPYVETCIAAFGAERCMFESNFPVDRVSADYRTLWNAFKHLAAGFSEAEKTALFSGTACRVYGLAPLFIG